MRRAIRCWSHACTPCLPSQTELGLVGTKHGDQKEYHSCAQAVHGCSPVCESCVSSRAELGLTGTKLGCSEGGCGACTVMVSSIEGPEGKLTHKAVNACLCPLYAVESCHVVTVEGASAGQQHT